ncbi:MAG: phosphotransferase [Spartobacteria bacterium]
MTENLAPRRSIRHRSIEEAITPELVEGAASLWSDRSRPPAPLPAVQNFVYAIQHARGPAILRLTHESHRSLPEVEAELRWVTELRERGLPVPTVYRSLRGALCEIVQSAHGRFVVAAFERLAGEEPDPEDPARWNGQTLEQLGALIARLHQSSYDAAWRPATMGRRTWREESVAQNFHFYVPVEETGVHDAFDRVLQELDQLPCMRDSYGLIHADLNHANFFLTPTGLGIFDFDDSCFCWFAYDLLVPIYHFPAAEPDVMEARAQEALRQIVRGYESIRRCNRQWLEWLPLLSRWRDLLIYGFYYEQLEIAVLPDRLRRNFLAMRDRIETGRPIANLGDTR